VIQRLSHTGIYVLDQDAAREFYVDKLGFEVRDDHTMENGFRWLTVGAKAQPDLNIILMREDGPNIQPELAKTLRGSGADFIAEYVRATRALPTAPRFFTPEITAAILRPCN